MNIDQKLTAIRDVIQQDIGHRGLARDPLDNLLTATREDFADACHGIAEIEWPGVAMFTGFFIPGANPPAFETDGPLGVMFLSSVFALADVAVMVLSDSALSHVFWDPRPTTDRMRWVHASLPPNIHRKKSLRQLPRVFQDYPITHFLSVECAGYAQSNRCYSMRGKDITESAQAGVETFSLWSEADREITSIGIGDGGNEIGMGKIPHETIVKNIPNGDLIHCRVATDHLIVAGVSNWGAYALAAGVALLRGVELPPELFDPDREREILRVMVENGPLVDGVTGKQTATVDGLSWDDYIRPLVEIGRILNG
jgi:D-glutamate cyclase